MAANQRINSGEIGAAPEVQRRVRASPTRLRRLRSTSRSASARLSRASIPMARPSSRAATRRSPASTAQSKAVRPIHPASDRMIVMRLYTFSQMRGTPVKLFGLTSRRLSKTVSGLSAKFTRHPANMGNSTEISRSRT